MFIDRLNDENVVMINFTELERAALAGGQGALELLRLANAADKAGLIEK